MSSLTDFAGLEALAPGDLLSTDGYRFQAVNPGIIDRLLRLGAVRHRHDEHAATPNPTTAPTLANKSTGGTIPAGLDLSVGFTWVDGEGGETLLSPVGTVSTAAEMSDPQFPPEAEADYTTGTLLAANLDYGVTISDGLGGETTLSPVATIQLLPKEHGAVRIKHLKAILEEVAPGIGGAEWRLWRSRNGGPQYLMAHGKGAEVLDDGSLAGDCTVSPPTTSTAKGTNEVSVTVTEEAPTGAEFFKVYISPDGSFTGPSLVAQYALTEVGVVIKLTSLVLTAGTPPLVTLSIPGAHKIDPDTEMEAFPWKRSVAEPSELPTGGNEDGDVREALSDHSLHIWDAGADEWLLAGGGGESLRIVDPTNTTMPAEPKLKFAGSVTVTDEPEHSRTLVTVTSGTITYQGAWASGTTYHPGDIVARAGGSYLALAETKGNDPSTDEGVHWGILALPGAEGGGGVVITWRGPWSNATTYNKGDAVSLGGGSYISLEEANLGNNPTAHPEQWGVIAEAGKRLTPRGPWLVGTVYAIGDVVERDGNAYANKTAGNTGIDPALDTEEANWALMVLRGEPGEGEPGPPGVTPRGSYSSATTYKLRDLVTRSGSAYISVVEGNKGHDPETDAEVHWQLLVARGSKGEIGPKGTAGLRWRGAYNPATTYEVKDVVSAAGIYYVALSKGSGHAPPNVTYWSVFSGGGPQESKVWALLNPPESLVLPGFTVRIDEFSEANQQIVGFSLQVDGSGGCEIEVTVRKNGAPIAHLTEISATEGTPLYVDMTSLIEAGEGGKFFPHAMEPGDYISLEIVSTTGAVERFSGTMHIRHITWGD